MYAHALFGSHLSALMSTPATYLMLFLSSWSVATTFFFSSFCSRSHSASWVCIRCRLLGRRVRRLNGFHFFGKPVLSASRFRAVSACGRDSPEARSAEDWFQKLLANMQMFDAWFPHTMHVLVYASPANSV